MEYVDIVKCKYVDFQTWKNDDERISTFVEEKNLEEFFKILNGKYHTRLKTEKIADKLTWDELTSMSVDEFVKRCYEKTGRRAYSFATKVFNFIDGNKYPILDSYVVTLLERYLNDWEKKQCEQDKIIWNKKDWDTYDKYQRAYDDFRDKYQLKELSYKKTDVFLWAYGSAIQKYWKDIGVLSFESVSYKQ